MVINLLKSWFITSSENPSLSFSEDTDVLNLQSGITMCVGSIDIVKGYAFPQCANAEISSCWVMRKVKWEQNETNSLNYSKCCRNTWIRMYFYVSENVSMLILMKAFQKKMNICQVRSLFKKKKKEKSCRKLPCKHFLLPVKTE